MQCQEHPLPLLLPALMRALLGTAADLVNACLQYSGMVPRRWFLALVVAAELATVAAIMAVAVTVAAQVLSQVAWAVQWVAVWRDIMACHLRLHQRQQAAPLISRR